MKTLNHKELLSLLGEIDGISWKIVNKGDMAVILHINGREIEIIRNNQLFDDCHVTRVDIAECIERSLTGELAD